jgi:hypothetical protein
MVELKSKTGKFGGERKRPRVFVYGNAIVGPTLSMQ